MKPNNGNPRLTPLALLLFTAALALAQRPEFDVILRNGSIVDGTGAPAYRADLAVRNGFIHQIGNLRSAKAAVELDVAGLVVAPGFINIHSHATPEGVATATNMLTQGVTTEIINADGAGGIDIPKQVAYFSAKGLAVNLGTYIGFNSIWGSVVGQSDRRPTPDEIGKMRGILTANLKLGIWGVSAGLDYKPGYFARAEEVIAILEAARPWRTNFPNHDRLTPESKFSSLAGIEETIAIGERTGLMPVITHMKVQGRDQGSASKAIAAMRAASARGHETTADIYPYLAGQSGLGSLFVPAWAVSGGRKEMLKRFRDPKLRARIALEIEEAIAARVLTPENINIPSKQRTFVSYMKERKAGAGETMIGILEKEHPSAIMKFGAEQDLVELLRHPNVAVSCDCGAIEPTERPGVHPRYFGTFPRVLGHYTRNSNALTLEDAVRKMSGLPASMIGLTNRGLLAPGMAADIAVFDPATVIDHATYEQPMTPSTGVRHVLVNGRFALRDAAPTGLKSGLFLRRAANMPSRPQVAGSSPSLTASTPTVTANITDSQATFRFSDPMTKAEIRLVRAGKVQSNGQWASFTGVARISSDNQDHAILVIFDGPNPDHTEPSLYVELDDGRTFDTALRVADVKIGK